MSRRANVVRHGANHLPGGSDPIPGLCDCAQPGGCTAFATTVLDLGQTKSLVGYWRLGEPSGDALDSSGESPACDLAVQTLTDPLVRDVTGALAIGDDGACQFNDPDWTASDYFAEATPPARFNLHAQNLSIAAWIKPLETPDVSTHGGIVTKMSVYSFGTGGWGLDIHSGQVTFRRENGSTTPSPGVVRVQGGFPVADEWMFVVGTYDEATGIHSIYVNGVLIDTETDIFDADSGADLLLGGGLTFGISAAFRTFYGVIDEVTVWGDLLSLEDVQTLYASGLCAQEFTAEGAVLTADGSGGNTWAYPTIEVESPGGRFNKLNVGTNLTGTDEGDDSVTIDAVGIPGDTVWNAKGDLAVASAADTATRLPVGADGEVLTADSGEPLGVKWEAAPTSDPADDTAVWMPLTTVVGGNPELVWDGDDSLIPTLTPI